jgi:transcriptional regulator with XRE-family HTH domain
MRTIYDERYHDVVLRLKQRRLQMGLGQRSVAARLGYTNRWLSKVERMDIRIDVCQFVDLCRVLKVDASRMVRRLAEEPSDEDDPSFTYWISLLCSGTVRAAA